MNLFFWRPRPKVAPPPEPPAPTENPATRHEPNDINIPVVAGLAGAFVATLALTFVGAYALWKVAEHHETAGRAPLPPPMRVQLAPPMPRLQADFGQDEDALQARQKGELNSYGWVDRAQGKTRIPINRAMDLVVAGGVKAR